MGSLVFFSNVYIEYQDMFTVVTYLNTIFALLFQSLMNIKVLKKYILQTMSRGQ